MKALFKFSLALIFGVLCGGGSALWMSGVIGHHRPNLASAVNVNNWVSDWAIGSKATNSYMRSYIARHGLLGLPKSEAVYFIRNVDDNGEYLKENCAYRITGGGQLAEWWSITLYDKANYLPRNDDHAYSIDQTQMGNGAWSVSVQSDAPKAGPAWLSSQNAGMFDVMLRLYKPENALLEAPDATLNPPSITRLECQGDGT